MSVMKSVFEFPGIFLQGGPFSGGTVLTSPFFINAILPFVLIFTVLFALLQKSQILGEGKKQIDAIVSLVIALIVITFANAVGIINSLLPFLAVSVVIILVMMILVAFVNNGDLKGDHLKWMKKAGTWVVIIAVVVAVLIATGAWGWLGVRLFYSEGGNSVVTNAIFLIIVIAAIAVVLTTGGKSKDDKKD